MNKNMHIIALTFLGTFLVASAMAQNPNKEQSLKEVYKDHFLIGNILAGGFHPEDPAYREDVKEQAILKREYNCLTAENNTKMMFVQPKEGSFHFKGADAVIDIAEANGMDVVGHALVWHAMVPDWIFKAADGSEVSREVLIQRMRTHIHTVVGRYKGRIKYWDVVNEAVDTKWVEDLEAPLNSDGTRPKKQIAFLRESPWLKIIGRDYIEMAFRFAHEADPDALLIYNDYSMFEAPKARFVAGLVLHLKSKGLPIHGVGFQGHWHLKYPSMAQLQKSIDILVSTGVKLSISELDVGVLPLVDNYEGADVDKTSKANSKLNPYVNGIPQKVLDQQAKRYSKIFKLLLKNSEHVERVTFWGVLDQYSWINDWPVKGRTALPLLFDRSYKPKPAYFALKKLLQ
jgi:endo-1,4-beta-xylanase